MLRSGLRLALHPLALLLGLGCSAQAGSPASSPSTLETEAPGAQSCVATCPPNTSCATLVTYVETWTTNDRRAKIDWSRSYECNTGPDGFGLIYTCPGWCGCDSPEGGAEEPRALFAHDPQATRIQLGFQPPELQQGEVLGVCVSYDNGQTWIDLPDLTFVSETPLPDEELSPSFQLAVCQERCTCDDRTIQWWDPKIKILPKKPCSSDP